MQKRKRQTDRPLAARQLTLRYPRIFVSDKGPGKMLSTSCSLVTAIVILDVMETRFPMVCCHASAAPSKGPTGRMVAHAGRR